MRLPVHTPYKHGEGGVKVGLEPIAVSNWLEVDDLFESEIVQKKALYESHHDEVYQEAPESTESQSELLIILKSHLEQYHPDHKPNYNNEPSPLKNASLMIQEDLVLMLPKDDEYYLGAASLCAPSNWSLKEKFNKPLIKVHEFVPSYAEKIGSKVNNFFSNLPKERIFQRFNWSIYEDSALFQPAKSKSHIERSKSITKENAGSRLFIRVERQTIRRLPSTLSIAFTIRVHVNPLSSIKNNLSLLTDLHQAVESLSDEMKRYKSIDQIESPLKGWLRQGMNNLS
ncbi:MAG TPA: DUF3445 domain-containing protein [Gammaproteobacteria bacterium]|nr:DUF3445 domain-containing protein [Gammaproteobacteria bacterium]